MTAVRFWLARMLWRAADRVEPRVTVLGHDLMSTARVLNGGQLP